MWKLQRPKLGCTATDYVCGCGPNSVPWGKKLEHHAFGIAQDRPQGAFKLM